MAHSRLGDIAQLVERCVRNAEVRGSSPLISTTASEQGSLCSDVFFAFGRCIRRKKPPLHRSPAPSVLREGFRLLRLIYDETGARSRRRISFSAPQSVESAAGAGRGVARRYRRRAVRPGGRYASRTCPAVAGGNKGDASSGLFVKSFLVHAAALR